MNKPVLTISTPPTITRWHVESSHLVVVPKFIDSITLENLRRRVQEIADCKKVRSDRPAMGEIHFRYETNDRDEVTVVHAYFTDRHDKRRRFMRLRRG